jgi:hypothetical protein
MKFIRLTNFIINPLQLSMIIVKENKYYMHMMRGNGTILFGWGRFECDEIEVCKKNNPDDYKIVSEWIEKNAK